jgi:hypothetical protein
MPDGVLDEVEQDTLELLGVAPGGRELGLKLGPDIDTARLGVRAHGLDRLLHQVIEMHVLDRPLHVGGLEARELEQVIDERPQRPDVSRDETEKRSSPLSAPFTHSRRRRAHSDPAVPRVTSAITQSEAPERHAQRAARVLLRVDEAPKQKPFDRGCSGDHGELRRPGRAGT